MIVIFGVTGASGRLGRLVLGALLDLGVPAGPVVPISRNKVGERARTADFERPETQPIDTLKRPAEVLVDQHARRGGRARAAFEAAARPGEQRIVYSSVRHPVAADPLPAAGIQLRGEPDLTGVGVPWTTLRNALYADLRTELARCYARDGRWVTDCGDGGQAFVARAGCAAAAAAALCGEVHDGRMYDVTGPVLVTAGSHPEFVHRRTGAGVQRADVDDDAYERHRAAYVADPAGAGTGRAIRVTPPRRARRRGARPHRPRAAILGGPAMRRQPTLTPPAGCTAVGVRVRTGRRAAE